jgi:predicted CxxxxCH...CXXCH cytochrome family protein
MESASHKNAMNDLDFDPAHSQLGTVKTKSKPAGTPQSGWVSTWVKTYVSGHNGTVICGNVYCHSNGYISPETDTYTYKETPDWYFGDKNGQASPWAGLDRCAQCHGNSPNSDSVNMPGSDAHARHTIANHANDVFSGYSGKVPIAATSGARVHGNADTATTFNCNICHFETVKVAWNDRSNMCSSCHNGATSKGLMDIYTSGSTHVNGIVNVDFMEPFNVKSKAQLRNKLSSVQTLYTSWTRMKGYKSYTSSYDLSRQKPVYVGGTCSTVTCHNGTPMEWRTKGPLACAACHTALPN